ncbi:hypothetical protein CDV31_009871 [Fusarium ambrosium]|uniref:F-box domain-containing protein n=1 Tax=Fusarium ambrosium TaxID=131363 RepID=A0A428TRP7_9HYPO|nr:hypothetical protein CDV31_009871 [Fusarium ambrosium]
MATESMTPTSHLSARCTLLAMPPEIRLHIYQFCIPQNLYADYSDFVSIRGPPPRTLYYDVWPEPYAGADESALPGLLLLCRQITNEVEPMLYGRTTFVFSHTFTPRYQSFPFSPETKELMQKVIIRVQGNYTDFSPMDPGVWDDILPNLRQLGISIEDMKTIRSLRRPPFDEKLRISGWTPCLAKIFQYLDRALSNETQVIVDTNNKEHFIESIENQMPGRCVFQTLRCNKRHSGGWTWGTDNLL